MADHSHGYGQYIGHYPPHPPSFPPMPASSSAQPPYSYPAPRVGTMPPANYTASQSAYNQNSSRIPGLGLGGTQMPLTTSFSPNARPPWPAQGHNPQPNSFIQSQQPPPASLPQQPHPPYQQSHNPPEEGELSEGEFEDLYEPKGSADAPQVAAQSKPTRPADNVDSRNGSVGDADGSSIYDPHDPHVIHDESVVQTTPNNLSGVEQESPPDDDWEPSYPDRERSGSYSPHLSPREVHRKFSIAKAASRDVQATERVESSQPIHQTGVPLPPTSSAVSLSNGIALASSGTNSNPVPTSSSEHGPRSNGSLLLRSPLEAKKKAQEAILGLWPLKVRYQDYIDEGVDPNVVKALFKDIGLDIPVSKTNTAPSKITSDAQSKPVNATPTSNVSHKPQSPLIRKTQAPPSDAKQPDNKDDKNKASEIQATEKSAAEERKDKIARKLAAMAQKTTTAQPSGQGTPVPTPASVPAPAPSSVPISAPSPVPAPAPVPAPILATAPVGVAASAGSKSDATNTPLAVPKTRAENNAILQQKLAALKKQQAQLAADKARGASNESTTASSPAAADPSPPDADRNGDSTPKARSDVSAQPSSNQQGPSNELRGDPNDEGIPGLSFTSLAFPQPSQGSIRSLKRPVASDFDNYTPRLESLKRTRTDERLVIDVSDDEDVEMEIGSPTDELPPLVDSSTAPARQALSSFPPLSDGLNRRQRESPASSSAPTPPVHGARIDLLHKRIEETKRLIAEAEAKKAAKKATTQLSPKPSSPAPQLLVNLPKINKGNVQDNRAINNRRDRITSYELPRVTATLKEKQDRLKLIVTEAARLELEVQASLDEQHKLKAEMEYLVDPCTKVSPEPDEEQPQPRDSNYHGPELRLSPRPTHLHAVSPHPAPVTASDGQQDAQEVHLVEPQRPHNPQSPLTGTNGDVDMELNDDEALQAAIFIDNTHTLDIQMADADLPAPTAADNTPVANETLTGNASPSSLEAGVPTQPFEAEAERETEQTTREVSTDADIETEFMAEPALSAVSNPSSEPDDGSSESDVSMQQSAPELSQSDDESYEPTPAEMSDSHDAQKDEQNNEEIIDDILEEPSPNHTSIDRNHQESDNTSNEVKNRSCEEPLLLTTSQDVQKPSLEDLLSYKSPLSYFRAYRFHPKYFEEVSGGLKSMTFSARIDPMREVCPQVLTGESCPKGSSCEYQHFDSMVLQDAEIITQLGSADMFVGETRTKFIEGLKRVLNDLKANRVKDFDRITKAIVKHRQEFLGDKTKVLALDSSAT
ncbi:hypothetical protein F4823DRAFT_591250 [Ustulina deusta]|nr:hypothetical protein F4823DRAFT_591250 [Ustulina deusta]